MHLAEDQKSVIHYHKSKMEDIINNGGGNILICFWKTLPDGKLSDEDLTLMVDAEPRLLKAGEELRLAPGQSVTIPQKTFHKFWAQKGRGGCDLSGSFDGLR